MQTTQQPTLRAAGRKSVIATVLLRKLLFAMGDPAVEFVLWNGETVATSDRMPVARIGIADRGTLLRLLFDAELQFGEAYSEGKITVEGDLARFLEEVYRATRSRSPGTARKNLLDRCLRAVRAHVHVRSRRNVRRHYNLGNDFFARWLDKTMSYSCAYFPTPLATLAEAQIAKMNHVCRKLRLQPGQSVVEAGCGWGSLALHMARHFGVRVTAFNTSSEQIAYARGRADAEGLADKIDYVQDDYRNIGGSYDAFVSIGMLEHVGVKHYRELGRLIHRSLKPTGYGLIQSIGRNQPEPMNGWIMKRIFEGYTPALKEMMEILEPGDFSVLDVENLRLHYAKTLDCWRTAFEQASSAVAGMFDENFVRMWRLYLAGSEAAFNAGDMQLFQVLFTPQGNNAVPWTRAHLY